MMSKKHATDMEDLTLVQDADGNAADATGLTESDEASDEAENAESDFKSYSVDNLLSLRESPFCRKWPEFLDESFKNSRGNWDPDRWHQNRKHGSTPPFDDKKQDRPGSSLSVEGKRRGDAKDRVLKSEQETCLVLSPQRRSFQIGCQMQTKGGNGQVSESEGPEKQEISLRPEPPANRRVGSGRILSRANAPEDARDYERDRKPFIEGSSGGGGGGRYNEHRGGDRYGFQRDERDDSRWNGYRDHQQQRRDRGGRRGMHGRIMEAEPEWMSGGPVSQNDVIELRGFDDSPTEDKPPPRRQLEKPDNSNAKRAPVAPPQEEGEFNFDDVLRLDAIPGLANILDDDETPKTNSNVGGSRFSQFFQRQPSPPAKENNSRRSSIRDELGKVMSTEQPKIQIPSTDSNKYFAPISPAAQTTSSQPKTNPLMDMLHVRAQGSNGSRHQGSGMTSVEGLEAGIEQLVGLGPQGSVGHGGGGVRPKEEEEEMSAFKKFAALVESHHPPNHQSNMEQNRVQMQNVGPPCGIVRPSPLPANAPTEQDILSRGGGVQPHHLLGPAHQQRMPQQQDQQLASILQYIQQAPFNFDLIQRPEAQQVLLAINNGQLSPGALLHHYVNGNMNPQQRDIVLTVLKIQQNQGRFGMPPHLAQRHLSPHGSPDPIAFNQAMANRISPALMFSAAAAAAAQQGSGGSNPPTNTLAVSPSSSSQRVPSPQELVYHTQQIMQNALIKRKLEEQKENFRRRQETSQTTPPRDRANSDALKQAKGADSPLAFTPMSVVGKMAAERRDSDPKTAQLIPELKISQSDDPSSRRPTDLKFDPAMAVQQRSSPISPLHQAMHFGRPVPPAGSGMLPTAAGVNPMMLQQMANPAMAAQAFHLQQLAAMQQNPMLDPRVILQGGPRNASAPHMGPVAGVNRPKTQTEGALSRFFSPEVIAQAQAQPKSMPQRAMTLEEIERQAAIVKI